MINNFFELKSGAGTYRSENKTLELKVSSRKGSPGAQSNIFASSSTSSLKDTTPKEDQ